MPFTCCIFSSELEENQDLRHKQEELNLPQHKLISPVTTRWESTNEMISCIAEQQQAISAVLAGDRRSKWHLMPSNEDFKLLETLVDVFKPFGILTDALSGEKPVTSSAIIPILKHLKEKILMQKGDDDTVAKSMKQRILNDLTQRYELQNDLLDVAMLLDPRFKDHYLENKRKCIFSIKRRGNFNLIYLLT